MTNRRKRIATFTVAAATAAVVFAAPAGAPAKSNPAKANPQGIISSYLGPLGLAPEFAAYRRANGGYLVDVFISFAQERDLELPEGIGGNDLPT